MGHYWWLIKGFMHIAQLLNKLLSGEGASRKSERVSLLEDALRAFDALKQACISTPILTFANYNKEFLLETDASKEVLGEVLSQNRWTLDTTWSPFHQTGVPGTKMGS